MGRTLWLARSLIWTHRSTPSETTFVCEFVEGFTGMDGNWLITLVWLQLLGCLPVLKWGQDRLTQELPSYFEYIFSFHKVAAQCTLQVKQAYGWLVNNFIQPATELSSLFWILSDRGLSLIWDLSLKRMKNHWFLSQSSFSCCQCGCYCQWNCRLWFLCSVLQRLHHNHNGAFLTAGVAAVD